MASKKHTCEGKAEKNKQNGTEGNVATSTEKKKGNCPG